MAANSRYEEITSLSPYCAVFFRRELLIDGMSWIRVWWMHLASVPLKSH